MKSGVEQITRDGVSFAVILGALLAAYHGAMAGGFVLDDKIQIVDNWWIKSTSNIVEILTSSSWGFDKNYEGSGFYRPLTHLIYMAEYHLFGLKAGPFHLVNIIIHALNGLLLTILTRSLLFGKCNEADGGNTSLAESIKRPLFYIPLLTGLIFALNPINSEVVCWIASTPELSFTLFLLLALNIYIRADSQGLIILSAALFFIALLGKEPAVTLIFLIPLTDLIFREGITMGRRVMRYLPFGVALILYLAIRTYAVRGDQGIGRDDMTPFEAILNIPYLFTSYIGKLLLPINLNTLYTLDPIRTLTDMRLIGSIIFVLLFAGAFVILRRRRVVLLAGTWITVPLLPVLYVPILAIIWPFADRYLYLSSGGFAILIGYLALKLSERYGGKGAQITVVISIILLGLYTAGDIKRTPVWFSDTTLYEDAAIKSPGNRYVFNNLGNVYYLEGRLRDALKSYLRAYEIEPESEETLYNIGMTYDELGERAEAIRYYELFLSGHKTRYPEIRRRVVERLQRMGRSGRPGR